MRDVLRFGRRSSESFISIVIQKNTVSISRFGFVVSTRMDKRAVYRNRLKRLLRESVHHILPRIAKGWDVIISARSKPQEYMTQSEVEKIILQAFVRLGLL